MESFGQIEIYDELFPDINVDSIEYSIEECIELGKTYCSVYNNRELPLIVGSKFDKSKNPLKVIGYYIINGECKTMNSLKIYDRYNYSKNKAYLTDHIFIIENMFTFKSGENKKINLPINIKKIVKYSINPDKLEAHLDIILKLDKKKGPAIKNEIDEIILAYTFDCWLGLRKPPAASWRLLTSPELLHYYIINNLSIIKAFKLDIWCYKGINNINTVSENMKHYNIISDIESTRKITLPSIRELAPSEKRMVTFYDKYKICPVQTSDGSICGTVNYLTDGAKVYKKNASYFENGDDLYLIRNNIFIKKIKKPLNYKSDNLIYFEFIGYGYVKNSEKILSYSASLIPFVFNNPPVRAMFASKMIKQAIMPDSRKLTNIIPNSKYLVNKPPPLLVAIMPWFGYNVEDAIVISEKVSNMYKYNKTKIYRDHNIIVKIYVNKNQIVKKGDLLYKKIDDSEIKKVYLIKADFDGEIKHIENTTHLKIVLQYSNVLQVGDKMTSRHGQKGVVSLIIPQNKVPKLESGEEIDLIINPHAFPSRMTMGQLKEMNNTEEIVYIGENKVNAIVGKCIYYSLIHQVEDKLQIRNSGNYDPITKQPVESKSKEGGLRFGQMERDILFALNAWNTLNELWSIDRTKILWCNKTGILNPDCSCYEYKEINQYFIIALSIIRALDFDILLKDNKYSIIKLDRKRFKETDYLKFGDTDPSDIRIYNDIIILPLCLRSNNLNELYKNIKKNKKAIEKETKKLLKGKNGVYHKYIEGHRVDKCIRSVIVPDPTLKLDEVGIPKNGYISTNYGILNRQPSLNIDSLKLVKLKFTNNKTISINPLLCNSFNADFDGDEMNIYGILNKNSINELKEKLIIKPVPIQDFLFSENELKDLTANKEGILKMIKKKSKGKMFNYNEIYIKISDIKIKNILYPINANYNDGVPYDEWYLLAIKAREDVASKALNTPVSGYLQSNYTLSFT